MASFYENVSNPGVRSHKTSDFITIVTSLFLVLLLSSRVIQSLLSILVAYSQKSNIYSTEED